MMSFNQIRVCKYARGVVVAFYNGWIKHAPDVCVCVIIMSNPMCFNFQLQSYFSITK